MHGLLECALFNLGQVLEIWGEARCSSHVAPQKVSNGFYRYPCYLCMESAGGISLSGLFDRRSGFEFATKEKFNQI
jgi:hypothetical protein